CVEEQKKYCPMKHTRAIRTAANAARLYIHSFPHDALPISNRNCFPARRAISTVAPTARRSCGLGRAGMMIRSAMAITCSIEAVRSEEHTSELQSRSDVVCRLLLEKKNWSLPPSLLTTAR